MVYYCVWVLLVCGYITDVGYILMWVITDVWVDSDVWVFTDVLGILLMCG